VCLQRWFRYWSSFPRSGGVSRYSTWLVWIGPSPMTASIFSSVTWISQTFPAHTWCGLSPPPNCSISFARFFHCCCPQIESPCTWSWRPSGRVLVSHWTQCLPCARRLHRLYLGNSSHEESQIGLFFLLHLSSFISKIWSLKQWHGEVECAMKKPDVARYVPISHAETLVRKQCRVKKFNTEQSMSRM
jgi:hypothetical protein